MNQRLTNQLSSFAERVAAAESNEAIQVLVVELEGTVLKSNLEDHQNNAGGTPIVREYEVGGANTRGLSWKLNLLRQVAAANFCSLVRVGVHGGNTRVLGTEENLDITFQIYDALVAKYEELSKKAFTDFSDQQEKSEDSAPVHRVGWTNKYLIDAPTEVFEQVMASRESSASSNSKIGGMLEARNTQLTELKQSLMPAKAEAAPKAPKASKSKKKSDAEIVAEQNAQAEAQVETISASEGQ